MFDKKGQGGVIDQAQIDRAKNKWVSMIRTEFIRFTSLPEVM